MFIFKLGESLSKIVLRLLPRRFSDRILCNCNDYVVYVLRTKSYKTKPRMTFMEAVFATILFDLALFGTCNPLINTIIRIFTSLQNSWDKPFSSKDEAASQVTEFCERLSIQQSPWIWEKPKEDYTCLNDFFSRTFAPRHFPSIGEAKVVAPACCTITRYEDDDSLKSILIKGCKYEIESIGLPREDVHLYRKNSVLVGYLSPTDYHRVHSPLSGKCVHCKMEGLDRKSASVKFFGGKFNILNENKRLIIIVESEENGIKLALVVIGGIGVDTITFNPNILGQKIIKGQELSSFRAGGSAIALFSSAPIKYDPDFEQGSSCNRHVEVQMGESLGSY